MESLVKAAGALAMRYLFGDKEQFFKNIQWAGEFEVRHGREVLQPMVQQFFVSFPRCRLLLQTPRKDFFRRGDVSVRRVPGATDLTWYDIPMELRVHYSRQANDRTKVRMEYKTSDGVEFSNAAKDLVHSKAEHETHQLIDAINEWTERRQREEQERVRREAEQARGASSQRATAYATLGLKPGASWPDVQSAYREASKKYHPDALSGKGIPPHVVELSVERFRLITEAYQVLKQHCV